ncbi:MAG TPA: hypothetical protein PKE12_06320 [Kiritimatiellia bacterium]|nr:hypothetical protein [Kiritimatiellia bacterium]
MHWRVKRGCQVLVLLACGLSAGVAGAKRPDPFDAGFLASRHTDVRGDERVKAVGPFFEMAQSTQGWRLVAVRPFYSQVEDPENGNARKDYLWPAGSWRKIGNEEQSRYAIFFSFKHGQEKPDRRYRFWLLPFYFQGRDAEGDTYRAIFPFGGTIREFLGRDEISFVLFPLRSTSKLNDLETSNWLWPFISSTTGDGVERHRVFPFYGRSIREGAYDKRFVLWPIWNDVRYDYEGSKGSGFILFPVFGHMELENQETWWVLPPFFRHTRGEQGSRTFAPWPFIQRETGPVEKLYVWPLWGHKKVGNHERTFYLWPLIWDESTVRGAEKQERFMIIPFYLHSTLGVPDQPPRARSLKVWPLFSYKRVGDESRFRTLELWPLADHGAVERNWAPLWTIYSSERKDDARDRELLWGLHRDQKRGDEARYWSLFPLWDWRREPDRKSWSLLKGLVGRTRVDSNTAWRVLFFFNFGELPEEETGP